MSYKYRRLWRWVALASRALTGMVTVAAVVLGLSGFVTLKMPGESYAGPLPPLTGREWNLSESLRNDVTALAGKIGERSLQKPENLEKAAEFIAQELKTAKYNVLRQRFLVNGAPCYNLEAEISGIRRPEEIVIIGANYDSPPGCPGANGNASGVAALLALARDFSGANSARTLRFVFFINQSDTTSNPQQNGSAAYANRCAERNEKIIALLNIESLGFYSQDSASQRYPAPVQFFYPNTGNFIAFIGNSASRNLVQAAVGSFRDNARFPSEGIVFPDSDHSMNFSTSRAFGERGYPALTVTDTAPFRYPYHHSELDTPSRLQYTQMARVVAGLNQIVAELARML